MTENKKITITEVAKYANVSIGTVDRVVHNRGRVSEESKRAVLEAIEKLKYKPNHHASLLAKGGNVNIACLLPSYSEGDYWDKVFSGFKESTDEFVLDNINVAIYFFDQYNIESYKQVFNEVIEASPDGVIVPPMYKSATVALVNTLIDKGIPYVYIDTKLEEANYLAYYGMPLYKSGYLAAHLLTDGDYDPDVDEIAIIRIQRDKAGLSDPMVNRRLGFMDYMSEFPHGAIIHNVFINPEEPKRINDILSEFFGAHPNVRFIVTFNSRIHLVSRFLEDHAGKFRRVVGFDALDKNMDALRKRLITAIISLHMDEIPYNATYTLANFIREGVRPKVKDNFMHMDILTGYNYEAYK